MKRIGLFGVVLVSLSVLMLGTVGAGAKTLTISTTTSTQASGLLDVLLPAFKNDTGIDVKVIAKGTGAAIRDGMDGNVDLIFVHAKGREEKFVADGYGTRRYPIMHNDFVILGPASDPAGIKGREDVAEALKRIAAAGQPFISRGTTAAPTPRSNSCGRPAGCRWRRPPRRSSRKARTSTLTSFTRRGWGNGIFPSGREWARP